MGITSTMKLVNGRLAGTLKGTDTDRNFDVTSTCRWLRTTTARPFRPMEALPARSISTTTTHREA
jgi:hypothetical protein